MTSGWYQQLYDIIHTYVYGGVDLTPEMEMVATLVATIFSIGCFALPVIVCFWIIKFLFSWRF